LALRDRYKVVTHFKTCNLAFDKSNVDDQQKLFLLKNKWDIPSSFAFPLTDIGVTKRRFNRPWLEKYQWLRYSESENGVNICQRKSKRRWNIPFIFQQKQLLLVVNV
jgi:hypothetical protein